MEWTNATDACPPSTPCRSISRLFAPRPAPVPPAARPAPPPPTAITSYAAIDPIRPGSPEQVLDEAGNHHAPLCVGKAAFAPRERHVQLIAVLANENPRTGRRADTRKM